MARKTVILDGVSIDAEYIPSLDSIVVTKPAAYLVSIKGVDACLQNKMPDLSKPKTSDPDQAKMDDLQREQLYWRDKLYINSEGHVIWPSENVHQMLQDASKYWGQRIPGEGQKTYTDVIVKSVVCEDCDLGITPDDPTIIPFGKSVNGNPSKGKKSGAKVYKIRPMIRPWQGTFVMHVFDARLNPTVLMTILTYAGVYIGLSDWRPTFGRFELTGFERVKV